MTYYLKYRPKTIDDLDLASVRERLSEIVKQKKFSHAYLFSGPRGTGKTSTARILAREMGANGVDAIEMDAASNRGIDDIRELRERVGLSPAEGEKKAYIIDEVHMLTTEAFNALLKTLEEPPGHVVFFLCTTEIDRVPETIISRCVSIPFQKATTDEIVRSLLRTAKGEKLKTEKDALDMIAGSVDGSFREAQTLLEETNIDGKVTGEQVKKIIGNEGEHVIAYVEAIEKGEAQAALDDVFAVVARGGNIELFARDILKEIEHRLLSDIGSKRLLDITRVLEDRIRTIRYAPLPELALEIAAIELGKTERLEGQQVKRIKQPKNTQEIQPASLSKPANLESFQTISFEKITEHWPAILSGVREKNHGVVTLLSHCSPANIEGNTLTVEVSYQFHKDQLEQDKYRQIVEEAIGEACGTMLLVSYALAPKTKTVLKEFEQDDNIRGVEELFL